MSNPEQIVRDFCDAWKALDIDAIVDAFTDDAVYHNIPMDPLEGKDAIRAFLEGLGAMMTAAEFRIGNLAVNGDVVLTERVDSFTTPAGKEVGVPVMGVFEIRDGKIAAWRDYFDMGQMTALFS
jgi:limonene-1,2-epoxide hydrolase